MRKVPMFFTIAAMSLACLFGSGVSAREVTPTAVVPAPRPFVKDVQWVGFAAAPTGRVFQSDPAGYENDARAAAIYECEDTTGSSCPTNISVPSNWDVTMLKCGGRMFPGGSGPGQGNADYIANNKAREAGYDPDTCRKVFSY